MYPNILSLISFLVFAIYLFIGVYILKLSPKSKLNISVMILSVMFAIWSFACTFYYSAPDQASAWFWYKVSAFGRCAYPVGLLQIALILTRNDKIFKKWYHYLILYVPALFFIYETVSGSFTGPGLVWINSMWIDIATSWWYSSYTVYFTALPVLSYLLILRWGRRSESPREKKQANIIVLTAIVAFVLVVEDNGSGIPENFNYEDSDSLGMRLINSLVEQIEGEIEVRSDEKGTCFKIIFKETIY